MVARRRESSTPWSSLRQVVLFWHILNVVTAWQTPSISLSLQKVQPSSTRRRQDVRCLSSQSLSRRYIVGEFGEFELSGGDASDAIGNAKRFTSINGDRANGRPDPHFKTNYINGLSPGLPPPDVDNAKAKAEPTCRIVTLSDGKLPSAKLFLPSSLYDEPCVVRKLDDLYHAMSHDETRRLSYVNMPRPMHDEDNATADPLDNQKLLSVVRTSLEDAGYELLSRRDLDLCEALNAGYLLRLSILPDVSELDPSIVRQMYPERCDNTGMPLDDDEFLFDGRVLVFWCGYSSEMSKGRLILPKLDYLQASVVQQSAAWLRGRLEAVERWLSIQIAKSYMSAKAGIFKLLRTMVRQIPNPQLSSRLKNRFLRNETNTSAADFRAVGRTRGQLFQLTRYGGSTVKFVGSPNPNDAMTPFMICEEGAGEETRRTVARSGQLAPNNMMRTNGGASIPSSSQVDRDIYRSMNEEGLLCPYDAKEQSKNDDKIVPAMQLLERISIGNLVDVFTRSGRRTLLRTMFSRSELVEPTYEEIVVVWQPLPERELQPPRLRPPKIIYDLADMFDFQGLPRPDDAKSNGPVAPPIEIRAFDGVPMANLPAVLPKTKLVFRPADAFVFDFVSIFSFVFVIGSQKFDSPKLDLLALVSVWLWLIRTVFRYSNKLARYDLLVKKFLTNKIAHRNAGAVKYIATQAGSQRALRAALVHEWLLSRKADASYQRAAVVREGWDGVNSMINDYKRVRLDMDAALNDLQDLNLIACDEEGNLLSVKDRVSAVDSLKVAWTDVFDGHLSLKNLMGRRKRRTPRTDTDQESTL